MECFVNFSDRYWKHPRSEICYLRYVRIEFIHSDVWTRNKRIASASEVQAVDTIDISLLLLRRFYVELLLSSRHFHQTFHSLTHASKNARRNFIPRHRLKWYSHDIRERAEMSLCIFICIALPAELIFDMQMQWLRRWRGRLTKILRRVACFSKIPWPLTPLTAVRSFFSFLVAKPQRRQWSLDTSVGAIVRLAVLAENNFITWRDGSTREIVYSKTAPSYSVTTC